MSGGRTLEVTIPYIELISKLRAIPSDAVFIDAIEIVPTWGKQEEHGRRNIAINLNQVLYISDDE